MKRDPSLHIHLSNLKTVLIELGVKDPHGLAERLLDKAQPYQIKHRYQNLQKASKAVRTKANRSIEADKAGVHNYVKLFNSALHAVRTSSNPHNKLRIIRKGSKQFLLLKEIAALAESFVKHYSLEDQRLDAYKEFIKMGMEKMKRFSLNRFKTYLDSIYELFDARLKVVHDATPEDTLFMYQCWVQVLAETTGLEPRKGIKQPENYSHLVFAKEQADEEKANYGDWVTAQFEGLAFLDVVPDLNQLYGDNAKKRYYKYRTALAKKKQNEKTSLTDLYK